MFSIVVVAFSALMLLVWRQKGHPACKKTGWWGAGMVIWLGWVDFENLDFKWILIFLIITANLFIRFFIQTKFTWPSWCHWHSLSLASVKSRLVWPFWYQLTRVIRDKIQRAVKRLCICVWLCVCVMKTVSTELLELIFCYNMTELLYKEYLVTAHELHLLHIFLWAFW